MAKKNENLFYLLTILPWWVSVGLAVFAYVTLKWILPSIEFENPLFRGMVPAAAQNAWIAAFLLIPALISGAESARKRQLLDRQSNIASIRELSWKEFEELLGEAYRRKGYIVRENHIPGPDGGIDLFLEKGTRRHLVQCKQWRNRKVGVKIVREMFGVMTAERADSVIVVSSGDFTQDAIKFAAGKPIDLIDGHKLQDLVQTVQASPSAVALAPKPRPEPPEPSVKPDARLCPRCGSALVLRQSKKGPNAGNHFWGCSGFPNCRHTEASDA
ncbi:DUF2034 domain-containing protein [bacterium]|nr:DUF2034 domain-containing protein [bacterium]